MKRKLRFRIDAALPPSGPARYLMIAWLVVGGLVALFVPVVLAVVIWAMATGQDQPPPPPPPAAQQPLRSGAPGTR